ncbi:copper resistance CopC family protein [Nonomuraea sp. NPDC050310]|uniref:copper resistance CopC family protein n=1 Tax=unclassified Nonomuraea TaxID=2593643 RepID=UPI0033C2A40D
MRRLLTVLLVAFAAGWLLPGTAWAHDVLVGSDPTDGARLSQGPRAVTLVFNTTVRQGYAHVIVTGPGGTAWAEGAPTVRAERVSVKLRELGAAGEYVVGYRILSSDGHPVSGKISFTLTEPGPAATTPAPASTSASAATPSPTADPAASGTAVPGSSGGSSDGSPGSSGAPVAGGSGPGTVDLGAQAAEAAANGGAGMAVIWIGAALVILAAGTVVALRRSGRPSDPASPTGPTGPTGPVAGESTP